MHCCRKRQLRFAPNFQRIVLRNGETDACRQNPFSRSGFVNPLEEKAPLAPAADGGVTGERWRGSGYKLRGITRRSGG